MPWLKCKVAFLFVQPCVCAAFQGLCSPGQAKKSPLCRAIEAQSATQSQFQGIPVRPNAKVSPKSVRQLPWQLGKPVKLCMIFQQLHPRIPTHTDSRTRHLRLPLKLGNNKNYDYDVFIVLMRPIAKGNLPKTHTNTRIDTYPQTLLHNTGATFLPAQLFKCLQIVLCGKLTFSR